MRVAWVFCINCNHKGTWKSKTKVVLDYFQCQMINDSSLSNTIFQWLFSRPIKIKPPSRAFVLHRAQVSYILHTNECRWVVRETRQGKWWVAILHDPSNPIKEKVETIFMTFSITLGWICQRDVFQFQMSIIILSKVNRFEINESIHHFLKMLFTTEKKKENLF